MRCLHLVFAVGRDGKRKVS